MKKNILFFLLALMPLLANAESVETEIDGLKYTLNTETKEASVTKGTNEPTGSLVIPSTVAYEGVEYKVTRIGYNAFKNCSGLTSVTIPEGVTSIGGYAFQSCTGLTKVIVPDIAAWCNINFASNYSNPLYYAHHLYSDDNTEITDLVIPEGVISISNNAFSSCSGLTSVTIPEGVTSIGDYAFQNCTGLTSVTILEGVTSIGECAFSGCEGLTEVTISEGVTSIGKFAFSECSSPTELTIPSSVTSIGDFAFDHWSGLTELTIPEGVTSIGECAFRWCSSLTEVTIPSSVTSIGDAAFYFCNNLMDVFCYIESPFSIDYYTFRYPITLYVPYGTKEAYVRAGWDFKEIIEMEPIPTDVPLTLSSAGVATFASTHDLNFAGIDGLKAYIASGFNPQTGKVLLTPVEEVPAGTGLFLKGKAGEYTIPIEETAMVLSNLLVGLTEETVVAPTTGTNTNFILANGSYGVSFYTLSEAGPIAAGKAYLSLPTKSVQSLTNGITLEFEDEPSTTAITEYTTDQSASAQSSAARTYFTLDGRKIVGQPTQKGIYVLNGKKVVIK